MHGHGLPWSCTWMGVGTSPFLVYLVGSWYVSLPGGFDYGICSSLFAALWGLLASSWNVSLLDAPGGWCGAELSASHHPFQALDVACPTCTSMVDAPLTSPVTPPLSDYGVFRMGLRRTALVWFWPFLSFLLVVSWWLQLPCRSRPVRLVRWPLVMALWVSVLVALSLRQPLPVRLP